MLICGCGQIPRVLSARVNVPESPSGKLATMQLTGEMNFLVGCDQDTKKARCYQVSGSQNNG